MARDSKKRQQAVARSAAGIGRAALAARVPAGRQPRPDVRAARHGAGPATTGCRPAARPCSPAPPATSSLGRDLIPDDVPIIGGLDDLVVVVLAVDLFLDGVPDDLLDEKLDELGIDRAAFDRDVAQIRRLTPGPVRRTIRRVPGLIGGVGERHASNSVSGPGCGPGSPGRIAAREGHPDEGRRRSSARAGR